MEETIEKMNLTTNIKEELEKNNVKTIYEYQKTLDNFEIEKIKIFTASEEEKIVSFLFYDSDFFAVNRISYKNTTGTDNQGSVKQYAVLGENLNYKIRKIPNVAKTRNILGIDDIETRIYDVSEYIVLLKKEDIKLLRVENQTEIKDMKYLEYKLDIEKAKAYIEEYQTHEEEELKEEKRLVNRIKRITEKVKYAVIEPLKLLKAKLARTNEIKMLSDGKHSIFDKED